MYLYPCSMAAAVQRALGNDCTDREQKRKMGLAGKDFHSGFSNLIIVGRGSDVVGIITTIFSLILFLFRVILFPSLWWTQSWDKYRTARGIQNSGLAVQSHVLWQWKTEALANDELEGLATTSKKMLRFILQNTHRIPKNWVERFWTFFLIFSGQCYFSHWQF